MKYIFIVEKNNTGYSAYAVDAAGWWWKRNNINEDADKDDVKKVTLKVNGGTNALTKRKDYTNMFKDAMNFKDCKNKNE